MNLSEPFIRRPIATSLAMAAVALAGIAAFPLLPVAPLPQVDLPTIQVTATLAGASPETMASSVAAPLERQLGQLADVMTTAAALLAGLPLAFGGGTGSELRRPLGYAMAGGLMFSQLLTLYTTPVIYLYLDRLQIWLNRNGRARLNWGDLKRSPQANKAEVHPIAPGRQLDDRPLHANRCTRELR